MSQQPSLQRTYHGDINPEEMADVLVAAFNQGNMQAQQIGRGDKIMVQVATRQHAQSGGRAALSVTIQKVEDGVSVALGQHEWLGAAASLGYSGRATKSAQAAPNSQGRSGSRASASCADRPGLAESAWWAGFDAAGPPSGFDFSRRVELRCMLGIGGWGLGIGCCVIVLSISAL